MSPIQTVLEIFGGLALFIFGVHLLSEGLEKAIGSKLLPLLEKATKNPVRGSIFGMFATAMLQSSGLLMVTLIGLLNANLLSLEGAIGIMLGQEIGTTITGQLVSFNIGGFNLVFLIIGFVLMFFTQNKKLQQIGQPMLGFGVVFVGMAMMSKAASSISQFAWFQTLLITLSRNVLLGVLVGAVFTGIIQSSTAMTALVIAMGKSNSVTLPVAIALILGANIGSCVTGWLASIKSSTNAKRASYAQILMNIAGVLLFLPFIFPYTQLVSLTSTQLPRQIANAHTIFNIIVSLLMFPLVGLLARFLKKVIPEREEKSLKVRTRYIDDKFLRMPFIAVSLARKEVHRLGRLSYGMLGEARNAFVHRKKEYALSALKTEPVIDELSRQIESFLENVPSDKLNEDESNVLERLKHTITDIERIGDHANNLSKFARDCVDERIRLSDDAMKELDFMFRKVLHNYYLSLRVITKGDLSLIEEVGEIEGEIDRLEKRFKQNHINRLKKGICNPEADPIFVETLRNLERVSDHSYNIALNFKR